MPSIEQLSQKDQKNIQIIIGKLQTAYEGIEASPKVDMSSPEPVISRESDSISRFGDSTRMQKDIENVNKNLAGIEKNLPGNQKEKLSPQELKRYYISEYKKFKQSTEVIKDGIENPEMDDNGRESLATLAKAIDDTMQKINKQYVEIQKEIETIERMKEHEEKQEKKGKGFLSGAIEEAGKAFDALAEILLPPEWIEKFYEKEMAVQKTEISDGSKQKPSNNKAVEPNNEQQVEQDPTTSLSSLGDLSPSQTPNTGQGMNKNYSRSAGF